MQLTIWDKTIQRLLMSEDIDSQFLACALVGKKEMWSVFLWHWIEGNSKFTVEPFSLPLGLKANTRSPLFEYYYIPDICKYAIKRYELNKNSDIAWKDYLPILYKQYKSRK